MKINLIFLLLISQFLQAQKCEIGIGLIYDNKTNLPKSFSFYTLIENNKIKINNEILKPIIDNNFFNRTYGIEGKTFETTVSLSFFKNGKKISDIKCRNDWEIILNTLLKEINKKEKAELVNKFENVNEGKPVNFYNNALNENMPGKLAIQIPNSKSIDIKIIPENISTYKAKNPYIEIQKMIGEYTNLDINDVLVYKSKYVPAEFKNSVKPFFYPLSNTTTFSLKLLGYAGTLLDNADTMAAMTCLFSATKTLNGVTADPKNICLIKSLIYQTLADTYTNMGNRKETSKLFTLINDLNLDYLNSKILDKNSMNYNTNLDKVIELCKDAHNNAKQAKSAAFMKIFSTVTSSISNTSFESGLFNEISTSLGTVGSQFAQSTNLIEQRSSQFFQDISSSNEFLKNESFIYEGVDLNNGKNLVTSEVLNHLINNPLEVKKTLLEFAKTKKNLYELLINFYKLENGAEKTKLLEEITEQLIKIEVITLGFEEKNQIIPEKYLNIF